MGETIPGDFWLQALSSNWNFNDNLRVARGSERPLLHIDGRSREGTSSPTQLFNAFISGVSARLSPGLTLIQNPSPSLATFTLDMTLFAPPAPPAQAAKQ